MNSALNLMEKLSGKYAIWELERPRQQSKASHNIYIYIYKEMGSSYTPFLDRRFSLDLTVINYYLLSH